MNQRIRPSSLPKLAACPRWISDTGKDVVRKDLGTDRHQALRMVLENNDKSLLSLLPPQDTDGVEWAANYIKLHANSADTQLETPVKTQVGFWEITGTADVVSGNKVFDLKWHLDDYRMQVLCYALGVAQAKGIKSVMEAHVLFAEDKSFKRFEFPVDECEAILVNVIEEAMAEDSKPRPCQYCSGCGNILTCSAYAEMIKIVNMGLELDLPQPDPTKLKTAEEAGKALYIARNLKRWIHAVEGCAKLLATKGIEPTGFRSTIRRGNRYIKSLTEAYKVCGLPQDEFLSICTVTPLKLFRKYAEFAGVGPKVAEKKLLDRLGNLVDRRSSSYVLRSIRDLVVREYEKIEEESSEPENNRTESEE